MSRKREAALQTTLTNDSEYDNFITMDGKLSVIDCFQSWTGPCKSITSTLKRLKLEMQNPMLQFGVACIDNISCLNYYGDSSPEPLFLFYSENTLIDKLRGCNVPQLADKIRTQLENEEKIKNGEAQRVEISYAEESTPEVTPAVSATSQSTSSKTPSDSKTSTRPSSATNPAKQVTLLCISPDFLESAGQSMLEEIFSGANIEILASKQYQLSADEVKEHFGIEEQDEDGIGYLSGGHSNLYILTRTGDLGVGVVNQIKEIAGPNDQAQASQEWPNSLNAKLGGNCAYLVSDNDKAISTFFPDFAPPAAKVSESATCQDLKLTVFSDCNDEFKNQLLNFGCKIIQDPAKPSKDQLEDVPEDFLEGMDTPDNIQFMIISCLKSTDSICNFIDNSGTKSYVLNKTEGYLEEQEPENETPE